MCLELLATTLRCHFKLLGCVHAVLMESRFGADILSKVLGCCIKVTFCSRFLLLALRQSLLCLVHIFVCELNFICEGLLEHLEVLQVGGLGLPRIGKLSLCLLSETLEDANYAITVSFVNCCSRSSWFLLIAVARIFCGLHQGCEPGSIRRTEDGGLHHDIEGVG